MSRLDLPRSSYDFWFALFFSHDFLDIVSDQGLRRICLQFIRASCDFLYFVRLIIYTR